MQNSGKKVLELIETNNTFIKKNASPNKKNLELVYKLSQSYLSNAFLFMILNRLYRKKIKFESTKFLESSSKNINYFFLIWDKIIDNNDYYNLKRKPDSFYSQLPSHNSIKNFYKIGLAIDQIFVLLKNSKNFHQIINAKKKNLLLVIALIDIKKIYVEIDPSSPDSVFYQQFINLVKREVQEYTELEWKKHSLVEMPNRQLKQIKDLIKFNEYMKKFLTNFGQDDFTNTLIKKIESYKKYLTKLEKTKKENLK